MKHSIKTLIVSFSLCLFLIGCDEDNDPSSSKNSIKVGGSDYALSGGILSRLGQYQDGDDSYYGFRLYLYSKSITSDVHSKSEIDFNGTGQILQIALVTSFEALENGEYDFDNTFPYQRPTFYGGYSLDNDLSVNLSSGTLSVTKNGNEYEFTLSGTDKNGETVTVSYNGTLAYYE